jgi:hypothetical protein
VNPIHRDDIPFEVIEEIERTLKEQHPGFKIICAGDTNDPELIAKAEEQHNRLIEIARLSQKNGTCVDCGAVMPDYPERCQTQELADGWAYLADPGKQFMGWLCPACRDSDGSKEVRPIFLLEEDDET